MDTAELDNSLREMMEKGFDDSFAEFCAHEFSSHEYTPENLSAAKMHAYYLRVALQLICDERTKAGILREESGSQIKSPIESALVKVLKDTYQEALAEKMSFEKIFIRRWCEFFSL